jgi:hypothetical protein
VIFAQMSEADLTLGRLLQAWEQGCVDLFAKAAVTTLVHQKQDIPVTGMAVALT